MMPTYVMYLCVFQPGVTMQSTKFSQGTKQGRGDTSAWTDTPSDRAQKAKMKYVSTFILECFGWSICLPFNLYSALSEFKSLIAKMVFYMAAIWKHTMKLLHWPQTKRIRKGLVGMQIWWTNTIKQNDQKHWCKSIKKRLLKNQRKSPSNSQRRKNGLVNIHGSHGTVKRI